MKGRFSWDSLKIAASSMSTKSAHVARKICKLNPVLDNTRYMVNRNPRNLEKLCIAYKPDGYHLENPGRKFWNK